MGRLFDIFVLIFCNSTASRLIYAYSHYNMCAGGGCMYQISNEKFGLFVTELRKKKNLRKSTGNTINSYELFVTNRQHNSAAYS